MDHTLPPRRSPTPCLLNTLGAVGRGGCPKWVVFCSSQAARVVQPRGAPRQPTLFTIPRWLAGGAAHLDHTLPPRRSPTPCLLNTLGAEVVHSGLFFVPPRPGAWSKRAAPHTNPHYLLFRAGWDLGGSWGLRGSSEASVWSSRYFGDYRRLRGSSGASVWSSGDHGGSRKLRGSSGASVWNNGDLGNSIAAAANCF